ncbi:hypothetical protein D3C85_1319550 [compost metagenome]
MLFGNFVALSASSSITLSEIGWSPGNIHMMHGNNTLLYIQSGTRFFGTAQKNSYFTCIHFGEQLRLFFIGPVMDIGNFMRWNIKIRHQLVFKGIIHIKSIRFRCSDIRKNNLSPFMLHRSIVNLSYISSTCINFIIRMISISFIYQPHISCHLFSVIGSDQHSSTIFLLC